MKRFRRFAAALFCTIACVALIALSGCGGGGGSSSETVVNTPPQVPPLPAASLSLLAGAIGGGGSVDGMPGRFNFPWGLAMDTSGVMYVADCGNHTIRKITAAGVTTVAGTPLSRGFQDGPANTAKFDCPRELAVDASGNIFVAENSGSIRKISASGQVTTFAGPVVTSSGLFAREGGIAVDASGNVYVSYGHPQNQIRKISPTGAVTAFAGIAESGGYADGPGATALFEWPKGIAVDAIGNVYVTSNCVIRKITSAGFVTTFAGMVPSQSGPNCGHADGPPGTARFLDFGPLTIDSQGNLFVGDFDRFRKVSPDGVVTTLDVRAGPSSYFIGLVVDMAGNKFFPRSTDTSSRN